MKEYLPVGTIIKLKKSDKLFMIIGYCFRMNLKKLMMYDYFICGYPEGVLGLDKTILIKQEEIENIYYMGYNSKTLKSFNNVNNKLKDMLKGE